MFMERKIRRPWPGEVRKRSSSWLLCVLRGTVSGQEDNQSDIRNNKKKQKQKQKLNK